MPKVKLTGVELLFWHNAILAYKDGDISLLEELIRTEGVPIEVANEVADILIGKIKPRKLLKHQLEYENYEAFMKFHIEMQPKLKKGRKLKTDKEIENYYIKLFTKQFYKGCIETGRRIWNRRKTGK